MKEKEKEKNKKKGRYIKFIEEAYALDAYKDRNFVLLLFLSRSSCSSFFINDIIELKMKWNRLLMTEFFIFFSLFLGTMKFVYQVHKTEMKYNKKNNQ